MSSHQRDYPSDDDVIIPWNRRYTFPTIANKADKVTSRIPSRTIGPFAPGSVIQIDLPAQGYLNPANTFVEFDVTISGGTTGLDGVRFQNNIQSIFSRGEIKYGSTSLEDVDRLGLLVRSMTEWTATAGQTFDQTSISEGIGGIVTEPAFNGAGAFISLQNKSIRSTYIQGVGGTEVNSPGQVNLTRRYCVQPMLGLLQQRKLLPVKYMANQLSIFLTLAYAPACIFGATVTGNLPQPTFSVSNVNLICETLNFDPSFDEMFLEGLRNGGIPIKFSSWRSYSFSTTQNNNFIISDRAKSLKALFAVLNRATPTVVTDSGATPFFPGKDNCLLQYQYKVGTKNYPSDPVQCGLGVVSNGGAEAYIELSKALYTVGNYQLSSGINAIKWGHPISSINVNYTDEAEKDFTFSQKNFTPNGTAQVANAGAGQCGQVGSQCFAQAISLETATTTDYSGLSAEEASSIILQNKYSATPGAVAAGCIAAIDYNTIVFAYVDKMIVLGEDNTLTLLE